MRDVREVREGGMGKRGIEGEMREGSGVGGVGDTQRDEWMWVSGAMWG
jgi:hypothetical protein